MLALLNILFPKLPPRPPTEEELEARRKKLVNRLVSVHAEGNVALSQGRFRTK